ncbi:MAG: hypothetical protein COV35_06775 [Alphaproteobacteria bacterium CG11_big_fil_rev_8_21_14_0_20_39_49]|nr:MAG: hypothetical protein COV35_06775 [Alphaproteobacteria bacterium CG11_big_fil_rev_8_21_14_0_20_39_49]
MKLIYFVIIIIFIMPDNALSQGRSGRAASNEVKSEGNVLELPKVEGADNVGKEKKEEEMLWKLGSIMYSSEKIEWVRKATIAHKKRIPLSKVLPELFSETPRIVDNRTRRAAPTTTTNVEPIIEVPQIERPKEAPAFYLSSILYLSPDNWSVWINGQKVSFGEGYNNVEIVKVTETEVTMIWRDSMIDYVSPGWKDKYNLMADDRFMSNERNVVVDLENGDISFVLGVNQSFDSMSMEIIEGVAYTKDIVVPANEAQLDSNGVNMNDPTGLAGDVNTMVDSASEIVNKVLPNEVKNNDNPARKKIDPSLKFNEDYIKQLEALQSMLGK